jgi:hypothetical protein
MTGPLATQRLIYRNAYNTRGLRRAMWQGKPQDWFVMVDPHCSKHNQRDDPRPASLTARMGDSMASEATLAWALADAVSVCFTAHDHRGVYTALGAGETYSAIGRILDIAVRKRYPLPAKLTSTLAVWLDSYIGNEHEPTIRSLLKRIEPHALRPAAPPLRGRAHLGGISQPLNMNALIPVASVPGSAPAMSATIIDAHGRPTR